MNLHFDLHTTKTYDVVGLGLNSVDHLCVVPHFPKFDTKLRMLDFKRQGGGQAATAMVACQRLGLKTRYTGKFGDDDFGHYSKKSLEDEGVDEAWRLELMERVNDVSDITGIQIHPDDDRDQNKSVG